MSKPCIICNNSDSALITIEDQLLVVRCRVCGLIYVDSESPGEVESQAQHWEDLYFDLHTNSPDRYESRKILFRKFLKSKKGKMLLERKNRVLDIGCGKGLFLHLLSRMGIKEIYGLDTSEIAIQFMKKRNGINAFAGDLKDANYRDNFFDLITLWDVLEHIPDATLILTEIRRILRKGGILYIRVPNAHYLLFKYFIWGKIFKQEKCFIPKYHYYNFSPGNLRRILKKAGFERIDIRPGMPEIYGSLVRRFVHRILYVMSLFIFMGTRRIPFTCFMIEAESLR